MIDFTSEEKKTSQKTSSEFKVGDRVRWWNVGDHEYETGTIIEVDPEPDAMSMLIGYQPAYRARRDKPRAKAKTSYGKVLLCYLAENGDQDDPYHPTIKIGEELQS